jgi:recombination protein RecR
MTRIQNDQVKEVVLATGTNVEGEATASYIAQLLTKHPIKVTRIASGVPMGGDLKYVDQVTLKRAMETRHAL